jgi:large subunit ribosomal protein L15
MVTTRVKKVGKYRAKTTHGGGHRKKRRGAGSRGGRGMAGSGKRASHRRQGILLGKKGFTSKRSTTPRGINLSYFSHDRLEKLVTAGKIKKEGEFYVIDLHTLGYQKLLGAGSAGKLQITAYSWSKKAAEKVESAGGSVTNPGTPTSAVKPVNPVKQSPVKQGE